MTNLAFIRYVHNIVVHNPDEVDIATGMGNLKINHWYPLLTTWAGALG